MEPPDHHQRLDDAAVIDAAQQQLDASNDDLLRVSLRAIGQKAVDDALAALPPAVARRVEGTRYVVVISEVSDPEDA